jgi:homoserine kinase
VVAGLAELTGAGWDKQKLLDTVTDLEGHPDNASPAIFGGFTVSSRLAQGVRCLQFPVAKSACFVVLVPEFGLPTKDARKVVPEAFSRADTMHNLNRSAVIAAAFASGKLEALRGCFEDRVHQPYRERLIPQLSRVIRAGEEAGAIGGWLSGAGSAIVCLALENREQIAEAMQRELPQSSIRFLHADNGGFSINRIDRLHGPGE